MALPFTAFPSLSVDASGCGADKGRKWNEWRPSYMSRRTEGENKDENKGEENKNEDKKGDDKKNEDYYNKYEEYDKEYNGWKKDLVCPQPKVGEGAKFHSDVEIPQGSFLTFVSGVTIISVQASISVNVIEASVPESISGQSYVFVTKTAISGTIADGDIISGPAVLEGESSSVLSAVTVDANTFTVVPSTPVIDTSTF